MSAPPASVVYVALGARRTRAAKRYATDLAAAGNRVLLVVADRPEWAGHIASGVTVRRVSGTEPRVALRAARKLLFARGGPLAGAQLLVAGDAEAMPIADRARRRFPELTVRAAPADDPGRRPAPADLAVVTPWYPSPDDPFAGAFVRGTTAAVVGSVGRISTLHTENWFFSPKGVTGKLIGVAFERELARGGGTIVEDTAEGELTRVVVPQLTNGNYASWGRAQITRLAAELPTGRIEAPLVHAHTGHYAGVVAAALARDDARIVVTEHATFLDLVFAQPAARRQYGEMLSRVNRVLCVGSALADQIGGCFPEHRDKLRIVPNPIDFAEFAVRPKPPEEPLRWLYVGRMLEHKGVRTLVDAFALIAADEPRATLTLVGSGQLETALSEQIAGLGLTGRITQRPAVPPEAVAGLLHEHDLLAHASSVETFGMTIVEAVATGTPVLVARSRGPAETLSGLDGVAGVMFDVTDDPAVIAAAYRRLRTEWSGLDLAAARDRLEARYGRVAVGEKLREVYAEVMAEPASVARPGSAPAPAAERIAVVAIDPPDAGETHRYIASAREDGYGVDLIVLDPAAWDGYRSDPEVRLFGLGAAENSRIGRRLERGLVDTAPRRALGYLRAGSRRVPAPMPEAVLIAAQRAHRVLANKIHKAAYGRRYRTVRPGILWDITRREVLPQLDRAAIRRVVVHGPAGATIGAGLAGSGPAVPVVTAPPPVK